MVSVRFVVSFRHFQFQKSVDPHIQILPVAPQAHILPHTLIVLLFHIWLFTTLEILLVRHINTPKCTLWAMRTWMMSVSLHNGN